MPRRYHYEKNCTPNAVGGRLKIFRKSKRMTQQAMADLVGVGLTAWNNWEIGRTRITVERAIPLRRHFGVNLNWLYCGDEDIYSSPASKK